MNETETTLLNAAETIAPESPVLKVAEAALQTASNPTPSTILSDVELAVGLVKDFKAKIAGLHPSVINLIHLMFLGHL